MKNKSNNEENINNYFSKVSNEKKTAPQIIFYVSCIIIKYIPTIQFNNLFPYWYNNVDSIKCFVFRINSTND